MLMLKTKPVFPEYYITHMYEQEDNNGPHILEILNTSLITRLLNEDGNVCNT